MNSKRAPMPVIEEAPQRTPERRKLAEAIEAHAEAKKELDALVVTESAIRGQLSDANFKLPQAEEALRAARFDATQDLAAVAAQGGVLAMAGINDARSRIGELEETVGLLQGALDEVREKIPAARMRVSIWESNRHDAVKAAVSADAAIAGAVEEYRKLQILAYGARSRILAIETYLGPEHRFWGNFGLAELPPHDAEWRRVVEQLTTDPDATFPEIVR
jgi:hypothetical protein